MHKGNETQFKKYGDKLGDEMRRRQKIGTQKKLEKLGKEGLSEQMRKIRSQRKTYPKRIKA